MLLSILSGSPDIAMAHGILHGHILHTRTAAQRPKLWERPQLFILLLVYIITPCSDKDEYSCKPAWLFSAVSAPLGGEGDLCP